MILAKILTAFLKLLRVLAYFNEYNLLLAR